MLINIDSLGRWT